MEQEMTPGLKLGKEMMEARNAMYLPLEQAGDQVPSILDNPVRRPDGFGVPNLGTIEPDLGTILRATPVGAQDDAQLASRVSVLTEAQGLVHGDRNAAYGSPLSDYTRTAGMVSAMLAHKLKEPLSAEDCAMIMCCVKLSRQAHKSKRDNMTDLAGYAECVQWMLDERAGLA
jgi:hypothetical protein